MKKKSKKDKVIAMIFYGTRDDRELIHEAAARDQRTFSVYVLKAAKDKAANDLKRK